MESFKEKKVLIAGASIAGLTAAYLMNESGYKVTVVEMASELRVNGAAVDIKGKAVDIVKRMRIFEQLKANRLHVERVEFKNADNITEGSITLNKQDAGDDIEIERDKFLNIVFNALKNDVEFIFSNSIAALHETGNNIQVVFKDGRQQSFDWVFGCDGMHSGVRKIWFGDEREYVHFLKAYFSITIVNKLLIQQKTMQMYNVPNKAVTLNAYNNKTDIIFFFLSDKEIDYDYRNAEQQRNYIQQQFAGLGWRTGELLEELKQSGNFYFDKFCQVIMPSYTKGRVALVGDAAYCASPAAGMGASLAIVGAATLVDALHQNNGSSEAAFKAYNKSLRPFIEEVQATARLNIKENFIPATEEAINKRNTHTVSF